MENTKPYPRIDIAAYKRWFMYIAKQTTKGSFQIDDRNKDLVNDLFLYFHFQKGRLDLRKGLWLEGPVGTGKSTLMQVFSQYLKSLQMGFRVYICSQVTTDYSLTGDLSRYLDNAGWSSSGPVPMCFDELGREPLPAKYYGTELNVMQHILHIRYSYWQTTGLRTFVTTNANGNDIERLYGDFIRDRRKEMFNIIPVTGDSRR
jgi:hypothetical protein